MAVIALFLIDVKYHLMQSNVPKIEGMVKLTSELISVPDGIAGCFKS